MIQPHINVSEVNEVCILSGNPQRVPKIAEQLIEATQIADNRGLVVYNGKTPNNRIPVTVLTTGMGCPSAAIVVEEAYRAGARCLIRVGSAGGLQLGIAVGDVLIPYAAIRDEHTSKNLAPIEFPATASPEVFHSLQLAASDLRIPIRVSIAWTSDVFYNNNPTQYQQWAHFGAMCVEMELSTIFIFGSVKGIQTGGIVVVDGNLAEGTMKNEGNLGDHSAQFKLGEEQAIAVAIKAIETLYCK